MAPPRLLNPIKVNTFAWYKQRYYQLPESYDAGDWDAAMRVAKEWGERISVGIIYHSGARMPFERRFAALQRGSLLGREVDVAALTKVMRRFV